MQKNQMKWIAVILVCLGSVFSLQANANENCAHEGIDLNRKIYLNVDQINFDNNKIYVSIDNFTYETPSIFSDESGYYIEKIAKSGNCPWYEWQCSHCNTCNLRGVDWECHKCKRPVAK